MQIDVVLKRVSRDVVHTMQIDVVLKYANRVAALADLMTHTDGKGTPDFLRERVLPNVKLWRASQDTVRQVSGPGGTPIDVTVHNYLAGYFVLVSLPRIVPALRDNAAVQIAIDRDKANARQAGAILRSTVGAAVLQDLRMAPVFAGSDYPFGTW